MKNELPILQIFLLALFIASVLVSSQFHEKNWYCIEEQGNYIANSTYENNLKPLFAYLIDHASQTAFGNYSVGEGIDKVEMIYMCRGDVNGQECHDCVKLAAERVKTLCPTQKEAIVWYHECMLRYSNRTIFSFEDEYTNAWVCEAGNVTDPLKYGQVVAKTMAGLIKEAAYNLSKNGYAIGEGDASGLVQGNKVYCYVQCTPDILGSRCERCLRATLRSIAGSCGTYRQSVEFYCASCQMRYSSAPIIMGTAPLPVSPPLQPPNSSHPSPSTITGGSTARMMKANEDILMFGLVVAVSMLFTMPASKLNTYI